MIVWFIIFLGSCIIILHLKMILFWLVIVVLCSLSKAHGDIETEAIADAVKSVDGYKQLTGGQTLEGKLPFSQCYYNADFICLI